MKICPFEVVISKTSLPISLPFPSNKKVKHNGSHSQIRFPFFKGSEKETDVISFWSASIWTGSRKVRKNQIIILFISQLLLTLTF